MSLVGRAKDSSITLSTKLHIPPVRLGLVRRPRLFERLQSVNSYGFTLVSAPAGFGKTTLLSQWAHEAQGRAKVAWLSLDEGDNDAAGFWGYFVAAIRVVLPDVGENSQAMIRSPEPRPAEIMLAALINDLTECPDFTFVIDDYHLVKADAIHAGIAFLLNHLPSSLHVLVSTRTDPPLPLARLRGQGEMLEIGADDLRFTKDEGAAMLSNIPNVELSESNRIAINDRTEGWAVGLAIAAMSLGRQKDIGKFMAGFTGSHRYVMDYLIEEVLKQQSNEVQDFLLRSSILDTLTASLCERVTGQSKSRLILAELESTMAGFLVPLDESRNWFRYHHLFSELLRHELTLRLDPGEIAVLNLRASQWSEDNGFSIDAVRYALRAHDWPKAILLIDNVAGSMMAGGETLTVVTWLKSIPEAALSANRQLFRLYVNALIMTNEIAAAEPALAYLEQVSGSDEIEHGENLLARADIAWYKGDIAGAIELSRTSLALLPAEDIRNRTRANWFIGRSAFGAGLMSVSEVPLLDAYRGALTLGNQQIAAGALSLLGGIYGERGELRRAQDVLDEAIEAYEGSLAVAMPECALSFLVHYERNELDAAARLQQKAIGECKKSGDYQVLTAAYSYLSLTKTAQGDLNEAKEALKNADRCARSQGVSSIFSAQVAAFGALIAIRQNDTEALRRWGGQVLGMEAALPSFLSHIPSRILIASGDASGATNRLRLLFDDAVKNGLRYRQLKFRVCQALAASDPAEKLKLISDALLLGQSEGFMRSFVDEGVQVGGLIRAALRRGANREYAGKLIRTIESEQRGSFVGTPKGGLMPESGQLSDREMQVLRLLASGLSNREISSRLFVSLGTVNVHVHNILEKLEARSRTQAVAIARELNLF